MLVKLQENVWVTEPCEKAIEIQRPLQTLFWACHHENPEALATGSFRRPWVHKSYPITQYNTIQALMDRAIRCYGDLGKRM